MRCQIAFLLLVAPACSDASANFGTTALGRPASLLSAAQRRVSPITRDWLVGYWAYEGAGCDGDLETSLWPGGSYTMGDGAGRWSLRGSTLTIVEQRAPSISFMQVRLGEGGPSTVRKLGPNEMQVDWGGGAAAGGAGGRFVRCD